MSTSTSLGTSITESNSPAALAAKFINSTNRCIFLTGKAGTGKTTFLRELQNLTYKNIVVVAPTGIAAINAKGTTIHSQFQIPPSTFLPGGDRPEHDDARRYNNAYSLISQQRLSRDKIKVLRHLELLVIDEVSMLRADLLDAIDIVLKSVRKAHNRPFGGVQVLFIGDLQQLPPVVKDEEWNELRKHYSTAFFFDAHVLRKNPPLMIELDKIYRQSDETFIALLNNLRNNRVNAKDIELLNKYYKPGYYGIPQENFVQLTTHNHKADTINTAALHKLKTKTVRLKAEIEDTFPEKMYPVDAEMELKIGAQIMFTVNDKEKKYFNGKIGKLLAVSDDAEYIQVEFTDDEKTYWLGKYTWDNIDYVAGKGNTVFPKSIGTFRQFPVKLAWAITVHKSQGLTFKQAIIDLEQAFAPGQIYVALSRLKSLDGLVLSSKVNFQSLRHDQNVQWYHEKQESPDQLEKILSDESKFYVQEYVAGKFDLRPLLEIMMQYVDNGGSGKAKTMHTRYKSWARALVNDLQPVEVTSERFVAQVKRIGNDWDILQARIDAAKKYFTPFIKETIQTIDAHAKEAAKEKKATTYLKDLQDLRDSVNNQLHLFDCAEIILKAQITQKEVQREDLYAAEEYPRYGSNREEEESETPLHKRQRSGPFRGGVKSRPAKGDSMKLTLALIEEGKSAQEVATLRELSIGTIYSHLIEAVGLGIYEAEFFVDTAKIQNIRIAAEQLGTLQWAPLREHLGESYSFEDIRFALVRQFKDEKEKQLKEAAHQTENS